MKNKISFQAHGGKCGTVKARHWTLEKAREVLPTVIQCTEEAYQKSTGLARLLETSILPENEQEAREEEIQRTLNDWAASIFFLGAEVKGLWLVDFDHGKGYYCWKYGEKDILYEHSYKDGFGGRRKILETDE